MPTDMSVRCWKTVGHAPTSPDSPGLPCRPSGKRADGWGRSNGPKRHGRSHLGTTCHDERKPSHANSYADAPKNASSPDPHRPEKQTVRRISVHNVTSLDVAPMPLYAPMKDDERGKHLFTVVPQHQPSLCD